MKKPLVGFTLLFIGGILFSHHITLSSWLLLFLAGFLLLLAGREVYLRKKTLLLLPLIFLIGAFWYQVSKDSFLPVAPQYLDKGVTITGTIIKEPEIKVNHIQYIVQGEDIYDEGLGRLSFQGKLVIRDYEAEKVFSFGDKIKVNGKITLPRLPSNPGEFDYGAYLKNQGIAGTVNLWNSSSLEYQGVGRVNPLVKQALLLKGKLLDVTENTLPEAEAKILQGILFGTTGQMDEDTLQVFRQIGVAHVLAVSGLHVGIILAGLIFLGNLLKLPNKYKYILAAVGIIFYAVMTGLKPSVVRATLMGLTLIVGFLMKREKDWPSSLAFAALVLLLFNPKNLFEIGFQLSFFATFSILFLLPIINKLLPGEQEGWKSFISVPLAAQIGTAPLIAYHFNTFSLISLLANLVVVQIVGLVLLLGLMASVIGLIFLSLAEIINVTTGILIEFMVALANLFNNLPGAFWFVKSPPIWFMLTWYLGLIFIGFYFFNFSFRQKVRLWQIRHKGKMLSLNSVVLVIIFWKAIGLFITSPLMVTFLDVGQADSILIQTPSEKNVVIDTGVKPNQVNSILQRQGLNRIDVLVLTHPHQDHIGGTLTILKKFDIGLVVISPVNAKSKTYESILRVIKERKIPLVMGEQGDIIDVDQKVQFLILHPNNNFLKRSSDLNENSVVIKLLHGQKGFLFTGDIEKVAIEELLLLTRGKLKSDVLKAAHHGSRTSIVPEFYQEVAPEVVVISVGANNRYGHPHQEALRAFEELGVTLYRTDLDGAVTITSDGNTLGIDSEKGAK